MMYKQKQSKAFFVSWLILMSLILSMFSCGGSKNPYIGKWKAVAYESMGIRVPAEGSEAISLEFKDGAVVTMTIGSESQNGSWKFSDTELLITIDGEKASGNMVGKQLELKTGEELIILEKEGGYTGPTGKQKESQNSSASPVTTEAASTSTIRSEQESNKTTESTKAPTKESSSESEKKTGESHATDKKLNPGSPVSAGQKQWNGCWYGYFWITETYGDEWAESGDDIRDFYVYINLDEQGEGFFDANDKSFDIEEDYYPMLSMWIKGDEHHIEIDGDDAWFLDMDLAKGDKDTDYWYGPTPNSKDMFVMTGRYIDPELKNDEGFAYQIVLLRWGGEWDKKQFSKLPPSYEDYLSSVKTGAKDFFAMSKKDK